MAEPKPIASLSSGLLARKGAARPAMRRQGLGMGGMMSHPLPDDGLNEDLGWNDMGYDVDPAHDEGAPQYGNLLAGAIPDAPAAHAAPPAPIAAPAAEPVPVVPDVVRQQAEIAHRMAEPVAAAEPSAIAEAAVPVAIELPEAIEAPAPVLAVRKGKRKQAAMDEVVAAAATPQGRRAAFTLRLDSDRHLKLRLASAVTGQSAQQLLTAALDEFLTKIPEIEDLAGRVPRAAPR
ncbi:hypothetical protein [Blastomonas sp. AAP53]|uniref:hypothetical protein n=1 Tax=Blastomonas sp. AAP53 TaxID=1248760 RepID=UPI000303A5A7|nr:hypothetical protein [Blastomonas sp. AAP53]